MDCGSTCSGGCGGACSTSCGGTCSGGCINICAGSCKGQCDGTCLANCAPSCTAICGGCTGTCQTDCTGSCKGGCVGCGTACSNNCTSCTGCTGCGTACSNSCSGCSGCSGCSSCIGTCSGDCNNACTATSQAENITNIGVDITEGNFITKESINDLKIAINEELTRRNKESLITDLTNIPIKGIEINTEHINILIDDYNDIGSDDIDENLKVSIEDTVVANKFEELKNKIKLRKSENIK